MSIAPRALALLVALLAVMRLAHGASQAEMTRTCQVEIARVEASIAQARKQPEYRTERGRQVLTSADRWLYQARKHAAKGEPRNCISAAQKSRAQI